MKYYKDINSNEVFAFELDGSQDFRITSSHIKLTDLEVDKIINPEKYLTDEEKIKLETLNLVSLSKKQFMLKLLKENLLDQVEKIIVSLDPKFKIIYDYSTDFKRDSEFILTIFNKLNYSEPLINKFWKGALKED